MTRFQELLGQVRGPKLSIDQARDIVTNPYKQDFPLLMQHADLAFLDSAATAQRPACVVDAQKLFYENTNANPLRGLYELSVEATEAIDAARECLAQFLGVADPNEIIFTRNTSESLNLVAQAFAPTVLKQGDEIVISILEHHSNLIPWQRAAASAGATLRYVFPNEQGKITLEALEEVLSDKTKIVAMTHVSNVLGSENPIKDIAARVHELGAYMVIDAAQSTPHFQVDLTDLGVDFAACSAHKFTGPFGVGVLWGKRELLEASEPFLTGGEMIDSVTQTGAVWAPIPQKFEAGTQDAAGIWASGVAAAYLKSLGFEQIQAREEALVAYAFEKLSELSFVQIIGSPNAEDHHGVISFNVEGIHPHDVSSILDMQKVAIRAGHHCAQPLLDWLGVDSCCRASCAFYNDQADIDALVDGLRTVWATFNGPRA